MALAYCEICGVLLQSPGSGSDPEGVICDECFVSRQTLVSDSSEETIADEVTALPRGPEYVQFECVYCRSLLRVPAVAHRTTVKCPQCSEAFYLCPNGRVEARLEGNTTAILSKEETLRSLTPAARENRTQPLGRTLAKTQPISPVSDSQKAALRDLAAKNLDVIQELPKRDLLPVDTRRKERLEHHRAKRQRAETRDFEAVELDFLPEGMGPGDFAKADTAELPPEVRKSLRASDEGRIDLDVAKLKERSKTRDMRKTQDLKQKAPKKRRGSEALSKQREEEKREQKEKRKTKAIDRTHELERTKARSAARATVLWLLLLLPAGLTLLGVSMTVRSAGFIMEGEQGEQLLRLGEQAERGVRALNAHVPSDARLTLPAREPPPEDTPRGKEPLDQEPPGEAPPGEEPPAPPEDPPGEDE